MTTIIVKPTDHGKFKILINYIQCGINYSSEILANQEANKLRKKFNVPLIINT